MKNVVLISASPKINEPSVSKYFLEMVLEKINNESIEKVSLDIRQTFTRHAETDAFEKLLHADAMILFFPLYYFCLPGMLISFLEKFYQFHKEHGQRKENMKVYAIVNCGFPEPEINLEAIRVIESFSRHIGADFRIGVLIGGGPIMLSPQAMNAPFMKKGLKKMDEAFASIAADILNEEQAIQKYFHIGINLPRRLFFFLGGRGWISDAKKNGMKKKDLYKTPYQNEK